MKANEQQQRQEIRAQMRKRRKALSRSEQWAAEQKLATVARRYYSLLQARRLLSYAPFAGEISPRELVARQVRSSIHHPRITNYRLGKMQFYPISNDPQRNSLGILEPLATCKPTPIQYFDAILVPLVAFDRVGNRLGMGAGFYDRALSFKLNRQGIQRPLLIGLAHHFQEVESLPAQSWDVPLDAILTDRELFRFTI